MIQTFPPSGWSGELRVINPSGRIVAQVNAKAIDTFNHDGKIDAIQ